MQSSPDVKYPSIYKGSKNYYTRIVVEDAMPVDEEALAREVDLSRSLYSDEEKITLFD